MMYAQDITLSDFINQLFPDVPDDERVCLTVAGDDGSWGNFPAMPRRLARYQAGTAPWYVGVGTVAAPDEAGYFPRNRDSVRCLYLLVLDDIGTKVDANRAFPETTYRIETSAGNYQYGYALDALELTPEVEAHYEACQRGLAEADWTDAGARGTYRVVRVPGSLHRTGFVARLVQWDPDVVWDLDELMGQFGVEPVDKRVRRAVAQGGGGLSLAEIEDPVLDWLNEHGYTTGQSNDKFVQVTCPWAHEHTTGGVVADFTPAGFDAPEWDHAFSCFHEHCQGRGKREFLAWVAAMGGPDLLGGDGGRATIQLEVTDLPNLRMTQNGAPRQAQLMTRENVEWVIERAEFTCRWNVMTGSVELTLDGSTDALIALEDALVFLGIPRQAALGDILRQIAQDNPYHPMENWLRGLVWDGRDHIADLAATVDTDSELWGVYLRKWLLQAVAAVTEWRGVPRQYPHVLVFAGDQGMGKSSWFKALVPPAFFKGEASLHLERSSAKDDMLAALRVPIAELAEIDTTFRKSDMGALKAFLSRDTDEIRLPYARAAVVRPRTTVFCGSVNQVDFLADNTGSRRFWPVHVTHIEWHHRVKMEQVWAQAHALRAAGEVLELTAAEDRRRRLESEVFHQEDPVLEAVSNYFTDARMGMPKKDWIPVTTMGVAKLLDLHQAKTHPVVRGTLAHELTQLFGKHKKIWGVRKARLMPIPRSEWHLVGHAASEAPHLKPVSTPRKSDEKRSDEGDMSENEEPEK